MKAFRIVNLITFIILLIGGINWLSVGLFDFNLVTAITFGMTVIERIIYSLVGVSAIWLIISSIYAKRVALPNDQKNNK